MKPLYTIKYRFNKLEALYITLALSKIKFRHVLYFPPLYLLSAMITYRTIFPITKLEYDFANIVLTGFFIATFIIFTGWVFLILKGTIFNKKIPSVDTLINLYEDYCEFANNPNQKFRYEDLASEPYKFFNKTYFSRDGNSIIFLFIDTKLYPKEICEFIDSKINKRNHL